MQELVTEGGLAMRGQRAERRKERKQKEGSLEIRKEKSYLWWLSLED